MPMPSNPIIIRPFDQTADDVDTITDMLHAAYKPLAEMGLRYHATWQDAETTLFRLTSGIPFVAVSENEMGNNAVVGTVTLYGPSSDTQAEYYGRPNVYHFGQFAVHPNHQRSGIGNQLLEIVERHSVELGATELALDTSESATELRQWYARHGYEDVSWVSWEITNYRSVIMSKRLTTAT